MTVRRFCALTRKPADLVVYLLLTLNVFASGSVHSFLHRWRWIIIALLTFCLVCLIVDIFSRKLLSKEPAHV